MEKDKDPVFVDPSAVSPRRLNRGEIEKLGGGVAPVAIAIGVAVVTVALIY